MARIQKPEAKRGQVQRQHIGARGRVLVDVTALHQSPEQTVHCALWQPEAGGKIGREAAVRVRCKLLNEVKAAINRDYCHRNPRIWSTAPIWRMAPARQGKKDWLGNGKDIL